MAPREMTRNTQGSHSGQSTENAAVNDVRIKGPPPVREAVPSKSAADDPNPVIPYAKSESLRRPKAVILNL